MLIRDKEELLSTKEQEITFTKSEVRRSEETFQRMVLQTERELFRDKQQIEVLREQLAASEAVRLQLVKKVQMLLAEVEELKDSCEVIKIRCRKYENKKMFNNLIHDLSQRDADD